MLNISLNNILHHITFLCFFSRVPKPEDHEVHIINLPDLSRADGVCLRFSQSFLVLATTTAKATTAKTTPKTSRIAKTTVLTTFESNNAEEEATEESFFALDTTMQLSEILDNTTNIVEFNETEAIGQLNSTPVLNMTHDFMTSSSSKKHLRLTTLPATTDDPMMNFDVTPLDQPYENMQFDEVFLQPMDYFIVYHFFLYFFILLEFTTNVLCEHLLLLCLDKSVNE